LNPLPARLSTSAD